MPPRRTMWLGATLLSLIHVLHAGGVEYVFPKDANIIDVKRDFGARGDGTRCARGGPFGPAPGRGG